MGYLISREMTLFDRGLDRGWIDLLFCAIQIHTYILLHFN